MVCVVRWPVRISHRTGDWDCIRTRAKRPRMVVVGDRDLDRIAGRINDSTFRTRKLAKHDNGAALIDVCQNDVGAITFAITIDDHGNFGSDIGQSDVGDQVVIVVDMFPTKFDDDVTALQVGDLSGRSFTNAFDHRPTRQVVSCRDQVCDREIGIQRDT